MEYLYYKFHQNETNSRLSRGQARNYDVNIDRVGHLKISISLETLLELIELF
jgi:hypothetical protein